MAFLRKGPHGLGLVDLGITAHVTVLLPDPSKCTLARLNPISAELTHKDKITGLLERLNPITGEFNG